MAEVSITCRQAQAAFVSRLSCGSRAERYALTLSLGLLFLSPGLRTTTLGTKHPDNRTVSLWLLKSQPGAESSDVGVGAFDSC